MLALWTHRQSSQPKYPTGTAWLAKSVSFTRFALRGWRHLGSRKRILDFGCGYGRILAELRCAGHEGLIGIDFSLKMLTCCRSQLPDVRLIQNDEQTIPLQKHSVDLVLLFAVLTCIPRDEDQRALLHEIRRVLRPGGLVYISDLLLNRDLRNLERYARYAEEYGTCGIFKLPEGSVVRHHRKEWIEELTGSFGQLEFEPFEVTTMNGNTSAAFQYLGRAFIS